MGDIENQSITGGADQPNSLEINAPGSVITKENPLQETIQPQGIGRDDFLGLSALRSMAAEQRRKNSTPLTPEVNNSSMPLITWKAIPRGIRALVNSGLVLGAVYSRTKEMGEIDRRRFLKGGLKTALMTATVALIGCGTEGENGINKVSNPESVVPTEGIDGLALLSLDHWNPEQLFEYLQFSGIGSLTTYTLADAALSTDLRYDTLRKFLAAAKNGENINYRAAILDSFDPKDNTIPHAHGNFVDTQSLATPNQFKSLGLKNADGVIPNNWSEVTYKKATAAEVTEPRFGGLTREYVPTEEIISGIDISSGNYHVRFLGESRNSSQIALELIDSNGQPIANVMAPRNVIFPHFNKDMGYRLLQPDNTVKIFTHLEARHPISMTDVSNLVTGIGQNTEVDFIIRGSGHRAPTVLGIRSLHDNTTHNVVYKADEMINQLLNDGKVAEAIDYVKTLPQDRVVTAYDAFDRINGVQDDVLEMHRLYRQIFSLDNKAIVYETLPTGEYIRLPQNGSSIIKWAGQLGRFTQNHASLKPKVESFLRHMSENRLRLKVAATVVGALLEVIAVESAKIAIDTYEAGTLFDQAQAEADVYDVYGVGEGSIGQSLDYYRPEIHFTLPVETFLDTNGQLTTLQASRLPNLPVPTGLNELLSFMIFNYVKPTDAKEDVVVDSVQSLRNLTTSPNLRKIVSGVTNHIFNKGPQSMNALYSSQNKYNRKFPFGVPAIPVEYGEKPKHLGVFRDPQGMVKLCTVDYEVDSGLGEDLGVEFEQIVSVSQIRDVVAHYGSFTEAMKHITPHDIESRSGNFRIKYSIINNSEVRIQTTPI